MGMRRFICCCYRCGVIVIDVTGDVVVMDVVLVLVMMMMMNLIVPEAGCLLYIKHMTRFLGISRSTS
jgi:hypothetical protein